MTSLPKATAISIPIYSKQFNPVTCLMCYTVSLHDVHSVGRCELFLTVCELTIYVVESMHAQCSEYKFTTLCTARYYYLT